MVCLTSQSLLPALHVLAGSVTSMLFCRIIFLIRTTCHFISALATLSAMRDLVAALLDVRIRVCLRLQQVVGLQEDLQAKEVLTPCKSIDLNQHPLRAWQVETTARDAQQSRGCTCKLYKHARTVITLTQPA